MAENDSFIQKEILSELKKNNILLEQLLTELKKQNK